MKATGDKRALYVSRPVMNADEIVAWANRAGFLGVVPAGDLHVTIAYSRNKVCWDAIGPPQIDQVDIDGENRCIERLNGGVFVLRLESDRLERRWRQLIEAGCSWDYEGYKPHITLSRSMADDLDLGAIEPFNGTVMLGAEQFEGLDDEPRV